MELIIKMSEWHEYVKFYRFGQRELPAQEFHDQGYQMNPGDRVVYRRNVCLNGYTLGQTIEKQVDRYRYMDSSMEKDPPSWSWAEKKADAAAFAWAKNVAQDCAYTRMRQDACMRAEAHGYPGWVPGFLHVAEQHGGKSPFFDQRMLGGDGSPENLVPALEAMIKENMPPRHDLLVHRDDWMSGQTGPYSACLWGAAVAEAFKATPDKVLEQLDLQAM